MLLPRGPKSISTAWNDAPRKRRSTSVGNLILACVFIVFHCFSCVVIAFPSFSHRRSLLFSVSLGFHCVSLFFIVFALLFIVFLCLILFFVCFHCLSLLLRVLPCFHCLFIVVHCFLHRLSLLVPEFALSMFTYFFMCFHCFPCCSALFIVSIVAPCVFVVSPCLVFIGIRLCSLIFLVFNCVFLLFRCLSLFSYISSVFPIGFPCFVVCLFSLCFLALRLLLFFWK